MHPVCRSPGYLGKSFFFHRGHHGGRRSGAKCDTSMSQFVSHSLRKVGPARSKRSVDEFSEDLASAEAAPFDGAVAFKLEDPYPCACIALMCNCGVDVSILWQKSALEGLMAKRTKCDGCEKSDI